MHPIHSYKLTIMFKVTIIVMQVVTFINCNKVVAIWSEIQKNFTTTAQL